MYINVGNAAAKQAYSEYIHNLSEQGYEVTDADMQYAKRMAEAYKIKDIRLNEARRLPLPNSC